LQQFGKNPKKGGNRTKVKKRTEKGGTGQLDKSHLSRGSVAPVRPERKGEENVQQKSGAANTVGRGGQINLIGLCGPGLRDRRKIFFNFTEKGGGQF